MPAQPVKPGGLRSMASAVHGYLDNTAKYWQDRQDTQSAGQNLIEGLHPAYAFGHAMGGVRRAAQSGDGLGTGVNTVAALPMFAWMRHANFLGKGAQFQRHSAQGLRYQPEAAAQVADKGYEFGR